MRGPPLPPVFFLVILDMSSAIRVLKSRVKVGSEDPDEISGATLLDDRKVQIEDITFCIRFRLPVLGGGWGISSGDRSRVMSVEDKRESENVNMDDLFTMLYFDVSYPMNFFGFGYPKKHGSFKSYLMQDPVTEDWEIWATYRWTHFCLSYRKRDGFVKVVKDGKALNINHPDPAMTDVQIPEDVLSKVQIARCNRDFNFACAPPEGEVSDFNIWSTFLETDMLEDWTGCRNFEKGNLVSWETAVFDEVNMDSLEVTMDEICVPFKPGYVLMPNVRPFPDHVDLCHKMHGETGIIRDEETQAMAIAEGLASVESCSHKGLGGIEDVNLWSGFWDEPEEGVFSDVNNGVGIEPGAFSPWFPGEPNGERAENCGIVWSSRNSWNDQPCFTPQCGFCFLEEAPTVNIRGLCDISRFDSTYSWNKDIVNKYYAFQGYQNNKMIFDSFLNAWKLEVYGRPETFAITNSTDYPFGTMPWEVFDDNCQEGNASYIVELNVNSCKQHEFNCGDGSCVDMNVRCHGDIDCPDKTDEINCALFQVDESYIRESPPKVETVSLDDDRNKINVSLTIDILSILEISEVGGYVSLQTDLKLTWYDGRLTFLNLKEDEDLNTLTAQEKSEMWIPRIIFFNTKEKIESETDEKAFATIKRDSPYKTKSREHLHNAHLFSGQHNPVSITRVYSEEFLCIFDMSVYPFDTQTCSISMIMKGNSGKFVYLLANSTNYLGPKDLTMYFVKNVTIANDIVGSDINSVRVELVFKRRILSTILTTYLPTFLICLVSFSTNYFKPFFFEAIVTVNLTSLLVLTTLFISVSSSLPPTAYVKLMDVWLIFCLVMPFSEVLLQTYIEFFNLANEINHHGASVDVREKEMDTEEQDDDFTLKVPDIKNPEQHQQQEQAEDDLSIPPRSAWGSGRRRNRGRSTRRGRDLSRRRSHMTTARMLANRGLPAVFMLFTTAYFAAGAFYYNDGIGF